MSNILTRLLLNTSDYDSKLKKAKGSTQDFGAMIGGKVAGAAMKFAGSLTAVAGSAMTFESVIRGSQTTSDEFDRVVRSVTTSIESFFTAVSTGDFTTFNRGLDDIIARARLANDALDQLGNTTMSYGYFNARNQADFAEAITVLRDKNATAAEREAAKATADRVMGSQKEITEQLRRRSEEAVAALVTEGNTLGLNNIKRLDIDKVLGLDVSAMGSEEKEALAKRYEEYARLYNQVVAKNKKTTTMNTSAGAFNFESVDYDAVAREMEGVTDVYQDAILYNEILVRKSDDWLQNLINIYTTSDNAVRSMAGMEKMLNRASQAGKVSTKKADVMPVVGSLAAIDAEIKAAQQEYANTASIAAREAAFKTIQELQAKKGLIELQASIKAPEVGNGRSSFAAFTGLNKKVEWKVEKKDVQNSVDYAAGLHSIAGALGAINTMTGEGAAGFLSWAASVATASAQAIEAIRGVVAAKTAEAAASSGASAASTPVVGWLMVGGAIATALAAFSKIPKFADGGIVGGSSFFGDKLLARVNSGEMILNQGQQARLLNMTEGGNVRVTGDVRLSGKDIYISLRNYMSASGNKL